MLDQPWVATIERVISSPEPKAMQTADLLAERLGRSVDVRADTGENDRTATGFVPPEQFEKLADAFFADPTVSIEGWETAADAQRRIVGALQNVFESSEGSVAVIGHGAVGTLLRCHLMGVPIDRIYDQPGQGHYYTVECDALDFGVLSSSQSQGERSFHGWTPIDRPELDHMA